MKTYTRCFFLMASLLFGAPIYAQNYFFSDIPETKISTNEKEMRKVFPNKYRTATLDTTSLVKFLRAIPLRGTATDKKTADTITLPMPNGSVQRYVIIGYSITGQTIDTSHFICFYGNGIDDPAATIGLEWSLLGFRATILSPNGSVVVEPYNHGLDRTADYMAFYRKDAKNIGFRCDVKQQFESNLQEGLQLKTQQTQISVGSTITGLVLAFSTTHEFSHLYIDKPLMYSQDSVYKVWIAVSSIMNEVNITYRNELGIEFHLPVTCFGTFCIPGFSAVQLRAADDPYNNILHDENYAKNLAIRGNQELTRLHGSYKSNFWQLGITFGVVNDGVAGFSGIPTICRDNPDLRAYASASTDPINYRQDFIFETIHELGHSLGAKHTFNGIGCDKGEWSAATNAEPGSGSTIMAYNSPPGSIVGSFCGTADDIPINSFNEMQYFHAVSFEQIRNLLSTKAGCGSSDDNINPHYKREDRHINHPPQVSIPNNMKIPIATPFILTGKAQDPDDLDLLYLTATWDEVDVGGARQPINKPAGDVKAPLFRSIPPARVDIDGQFSKTFQEQTTPPAATQFDYSKDYLPDYSRLMKFRFTVRDGAGGITSSGDLTLTVVKEFGPYIDKPPIEIKPKETKRTLKPSTKSDTNINKSINSGDTVTLHYQMEGTDTNYTHLVVVELSNNGGNTFPYQLKSPDNLIDTFLNYRSDDSSKAEVVIPDSLATDSLVIRIKAIDGSYFTVIDVWNSVIVSAKAFLQGPYDINSGQMTDKLRVDSLLPVYEPYAEVGLTPVNNSRPEAAIEGIFNYVGSTAITDWVWLELRSSQDSTKVVATRSALIRRDGNIVDVDGTSPVLFQNVPPDNYYVALRHRNHLGVMTAETVALNRTFCNTIDFTSPSTATWGTNAQKDLNGVMVMWAGDVNGDGMVRYNGASNDKTSILTLVNVATPNNAQEGYYREDINLNGSVRYNGASNDKVIILGNVGLKTPNNVIVEQLPKQ
jgi:hypothetical protein